MSSRSFVGTKNMTRMLLLLFTETDYTIPRERRSMNLLESIMRVLSWQDWKDASALPGWRSRPTRTKHSRTPYSSGRQRGPGEQRMHVEEFASREERNDRFRQLRERGTRDVSKFTVSRSDGNSAKGHIVWCVVRP